MRDTDHLEVSGDALVTKTLDGIVIGWSVSAEKLLGYKAEEIIGQPILLLFPSDRRQEEDAILVRLKAGERIEEYRTLRLTKDGRGVEVSLTIIPIKDQAGHIVGALKVMRDITERRQVEQALRVSEEGFRNVFEHAPTGIAIGDMDGRFVQWNPAYCAMLGYTEEEFRRLHFPELVHPDDRAANLAAVKRLVAEDLSYFEIENRYVHKNGEPIWVHKFISLLHDHAGKPTYLVTFVTNVTERRRAKQELRDARQRLQRWNRRSK